MKTILPLRAVLAVLVLGAAAACASSPGSSASRGAAEPEALDILWRMRRTYADCRTYRDTGFIRVRTFHEGRERPVAEATFATAFSKDAGFRYEHREGLAGRRFLVVAGKDGVSQWWDVRPGVTVPKDVGSALGAMGTVTTRSSTSVPALLLPRGAPIGYFSYLSAPRRAGEEKIGGVACWRLVCDYAKHPLSLWVEKETGLLRKIEDNYPSFDGKYRWECTTTYAPVMDQDLPEGSLRFDPPPGVTAPTSP